MLFSYSLLVVEPANSSGVWPLVLPGWLCRLRLTRARRRRLTALLVAAGDVWACVLRRYSDAGRARGSLAGTGPPRPPPPGRPGSRSPRGEDPVSTPDELTETCT